MPHLQFEINVAATDVQKIAFANAVKQHFATIMDTGTDHVAVTIRCFGTHDLSFDRATAPTDGIGFVNADIRQGRTDRQKRDLSVAMIAELDAAFGIPQPNVYVILTEHPGDDFQFHDRVLPGWSEGEDPLAD